MFFGETEKPLKKENKNVPLKGENIETEIKAGKDPKVAAAIAYSIQRKNEDLNSMDYTRSKELAKEITEDPNVDKYIAASGKECYRVYAPLDWYLIKCAEAGLDPIWTGDFKYEASNDYIEFDWVEEDAILHIKNLDESLQESAETKEKYTCVICKNEFTGYGNNAQPVADGTCCDKCNREVVIPKRIEDMKFKSIDESLFTDEEQKEFFDKAKEAGLKTVGDLERIRKEPEFINDDGTRKSDLDGIRAYTDAIKEEPVEESIEEKETNESLEESVESTETTPVNEALNEKEEYASLNEDFDIEDPEPIYSDEIVLDEIEEPVDVVTEPTVNVTEEPTEVTVIPGEKIAGNDDLYIDPFDNTVHDEDIVADDFGDADIERLKIKMDAVNNQPKETVEVTSDVIAEPVASEDTVVDYVNPNMTAQPTEEIPVNLDELD